MVRIHSPRPFHSFPSMPVKRFLIRGIVQGVGFRYFTRRTARELELAGYVRNLDDGSVEAVAQGDEERLRVLEAKLRQGPAGSRVEAVRVEDYTAEIAPGAFVIR